MKGHIQITFHQIELEQQEWMIAHLSEAGYEGFEQGSTELKAFIPEENYDKAVLHELAFKYQLRYEESVIPEQNWNNVWESNFHPVIVDDFVGIRAHFHEKIKNVEHEIIITPKMSFGTGHHATTFLMMQQMRDIDFTGKKVFDFGTGTGVLAILAEKLGASSVLAVDIDDWSIENATENAARNNCGRISLVKTDTAAADREFGIILANINRNVILDNMEVLVQQLENGGVLLLSGLLREDETVIIQAAKKTKLHYAGLAAKDNWLCIKFLG